MSNEPTTETVPIPTLRAAQVYAMAVLCLVIGLAIGYFFHGSQLQTGTNSATPTGGGAISGQAAAARQMPTGSQAQSAGGAAMQSPHGSAMGGRMPTMQDMKQMADSKAAPVLAKLKKDPNNTDLLDQVGAIYHSTHQFKEAAAYYNKAVQVEPKNVGLRTKLAISLYRSGDVDGAIAQLNSGLSYDPKDANSLFDLGMIRLEGKQDSKSALAAWRQLLKSNPQLSADRRASVQKLIDHVQSPVGDQRAAEGVPTK
jgi:cytochrome c-type biogenesis protein CcmH/NrfG